MGKRYDKLDQIIQKTIKNNEEINNPAAIEITDMPRPELVYYGIKQVIGQDEKRKKFMKRLLIGIAIAIIMIALPIHLYPKNQSADNQEYQKAHNGWETATVNEQDAFEDEDETWEKDHRGKRIHTDTEEQE